MVTIGPMTVYVVVTQSEHCDLKLLPLVMTVRMVSAVDFGH